MAVARNLDRILPSVSGDLDRVMGEVQVLPDAQFATAFASLSPVTYAGESAAALGGAQRYVSVIGDRMMSLRDGELARSAGDKAPPLPLRVAYNGSTPSGLFGAADEAAAARSLGGWTRAFGQKGDRTAGGGANGYEYDLNGISVGLDRRLGDRLVAGVNVATARNEVKADLDMSNSDIDSTYASLYGDYFDRRLYVNGALSYGKNDYDTRRNIVVGPTTTPVSSNHGGTLLAATAGVGYYLRAGAWWLDPFASLQYARLREDGFTEAGSGAGLIVADRTTNALVSTLGARVSRIIESGGGSWIPQASLAWTHDYGIDEHLVAASYVDAPEAVFSISGEPIDRNGAAIGLAIAYRTGEGLTTLLGYRGEFRSHFDAHGVVGELRYEF